ncbi:MAG: DUF547 domain-containing protein [Bacteroidota bacterium]
MKRIVFISLLTAIASSCISKPEVTSETVPSHELWTIILKKYVTPEGLVNYSGLVNDKTELNKYLELLSNHAPNEKKWTYEEQLAYWINAYNAFTLKLIVDNYPVQSIKDLHPINIPFVSSVWQKKFFEIGGEKMNLDYIEHKILRKQFEEPRIHFAINCASLSCPELLNEAYSPKKLEEQLEQQTVKFINDPKRNNISREALKLSKIFSWFKGDFTKEKELIDFINQYSKTVVGRGVDVSYLDYNWSLNEGK